MLCLTNTLSRKKEKFEPLEAGKVSMYVCGPTVYGLTHIGNAWPAVFFDVVRRYLEFSGYKVNYVSNFTDVDDKIINKAREAGVSSTEISEKYTIDYLKDMSDLGVRPPNKAPKVTENLDRIIKFIAGLVENDSAYVAKDGEVFFAVRKFESYGKLSGKNIDDLLVGARVERNDNKKDPLDFSLWKPQKSDDEPAWDSPWGKGRPGWHIECSVMATHFLGETFDIHGGGIDLIHPHHENEIAQSEALTKQPFVKYWMHNNHLTINAEKMSKSLGNIFLNREFINQHSAEVLRYLLLSSHYRSPINFSEKQIREVQAALHRLYTTKKKVLDLLAKSIDGNAPAASGEKKVIELSKSFQSRWIEAMDDDFNTSRAVGFVFEYVRALNAYLDSNKFKASSNTRTILEEFKSLLAVFSGVVNLFGEDPDVFLVGLRNKVLDQLGLKAEDIESKICERAEARKDKDFTKADAIRDELLKLGIEICDTAKGCTWDVTFTD